MTDEDRNDLAYWFPRLESTGVAVPKTVILNTTFPFEEIMDGRRRTRQERRELGDFVFALHDAAMSVGGYPAFLRSGHMSGKHRFSLTCRIEGPRDWETHLMAIAENEAMAFMFETVGLGVWAVREWLTLPHRFTIYKGMPWATEARVFVRDGHVECVHPYWPIDAVEAGRPTRASAIAGSITNVDDDWRAEWTRQFQTIADHTLVLSVLAERAARAFDGYWSMDFAWGIRPRAAVMADGQGLGWTAIDMADGVRSYHWPECERCPEEQRIAQAR